MGSATQCRGLLDHLVCLEKQGPGKRQAKSLRGLQIDDQLKLHGLLHGQVTWLGTLQDSIDVVGGAPEQVRKARPIGHEAPSFDKLSEVVHRWQSAFGYQIHNPDAVR